MPRTLLTRPFPLPLDPWNARSFEAQYARDVEVTNGRAAMVGFLAAVLVEAATDKGIIMQVGIDSLTRAVHIWQGASRGVS